MVATVIVTMKVMPISPEEDLNPIREATTSLITEFGGTVGMMRDGSIAIKVEPVAFGLQALVFMFSMNEALGGTEELEAKITTIPGVNSVQVTDVRRAVG